MLYSFKGKAGFKERVFEVLKKKNCFHIKKNFKLYLDNSVN